MSIINFISNLINKFGGWIADLFESSEALYNKLSAEEKAAANYAYGVIALINKYGDQALPYIQKAYPELAIDQLHGFLDILLNDIKAVDDNVPLTLEDALKAVADHLGKLDGATWAAVSQTLGSLLATLFSPSTPVQKFISIAEYVYVILVKPHVSSVSVMASKDGDPVPPDATHPKPKS